MNIPKSNRKKKSTKSHNSSQPQNNPNPQPYYSNLPIDLNSDLDTNFQNFPNYGSQNLNFSNPSTFTPFPFQPPQNPNYSNSPNVIPSLARDSLQHFVEGIVSYFSDEYLRKPNEEDLVRLLRIGERRGFPGMLGSIDCMHWRWKNCPLRLKGMFSGRPGKPTLILEAVASYDLWIWHAFFGTPGSRNDINVLDRSPLFNDVFEGCAPSINYVVNGRTYNMGYYLTDGIYPKWAAFIPTISLPQNEKEGLFAKVQEAKRKDVERAFGVLQARFAIIRNPALARDASMLEKIMIACIIMHNMIVEDERDTYKTYYDPNEYDQATNASSSNENNEEPFQFQNSNNRIASLETYMSNRARVRDEAMHKALKKDLVEHMWLKFGVQSRDNNMH
ncbi:uncharacterized protein LOC110738554 [Chenopodium quinoa]|uniref:uncharacterized protein LOC110738554 n=1 Tax=Chenopodium quinoa TaxID=63459 RepID=UPI000B775F00|nr:uncharacterized protein LOC110738554 [Chenopodium quinoa]